MDQIHILTSSYPKPVESVPTIGNGSVRNQMFIFHSKENKPN